MKKNMEAISAGCPVLYIILYTLYMIIIMYNVYNI